MNASDGSTQASLAGREQENPNVMYEITAPCSEHGRNFKRTKNERALFVDLPLAASSSPRKVQIYGRAGCRNGRVRALRRDQAVRVGAASDVRAGETRSLTSMHESFGASGVPFGVCGDGGDVFLTVGGGGLGLEVVASVTQWSRILKPVPICCLLGQPG